MLALLPLLLTLAPQDASSTSTLADEELLALYCASAEKIFVDPKDAALLAALRLLDDRLAELPVELQAEGQVPPDAIPMVTRLFSGSKSLKVGISGEAMPGMPLPLFAQLALPELSPGEAGEVAARVGRLMELTGMPPTTFNADGLAQLPGPFPAWFGAHAGNFMVAVGKTSNPGVSLTDHGLPAGVEPTFIFRMDFARFFELGMGFAEAYGGEEAAQLNEMLTLAGVDKLKMSVATGTDGERRHMVTRMPGYAKAMRDAGTGPNGPMDAELLRMIPQDATWAFAGAVNVRGGLEMMLKMIEKNFGDAMGGADPLDMLASMMGGVHLMNDVVGHIGSTGGIYASDTTGGGGFLSTVAFIELSGADELYDAEETIGGILNMIAGAQAKGYVQVRYWERDGTDYQTLTFPGLPVPFEPTIAHAGNCLIVCATPSTAVAAVAQARSGSTSIMDNTRFTEQLPNGLDNAYSVTYFDAPRLIRDGYGATNLLCSALANATRSPSSPQRDAGIIIPGYHELMAGSKATVALAWADGDDFIQHQQSDRSVLVSMASSFGFISSSPLLFVLPAIAVPALMGKLE
ncbi:MAG: hypothetical protein ACI8QZ_002520 [Chlamydiales bacterium]|jgi:hypothetical protein